MANLKVLDLATAVDDEKIDNYKKRIDSTLEVSIDYDKTNNSLAWLDLMEDTVHYIDNILRNPNKFIVNEEDVIKIELAKRVTVESIKHLSRNTNLIQDYDKETGDVKPSKILNISKEESYDTYENKLIFTLIQNMKYFIAMRKKDLQISGNSKNSKKFKYTAEAKYTKDKINMEMNFDANEQMDSAKTLQEVADRIEKLEIQIAGLTRSDVYKSVEKLHAAPIVPPIKKTNVILKNPNFQQAMKLWDFLQSNDDGKSTRKQMKESYKDDGVLKEYLDETFLLNYLVSRTLNGGQVDIPVEKLEENLVGSMVQKVMAMDGEMELEDLKDIVEKQYTVVKYRNVVSDKKIADIFKDKIDKYLDKVEKIGKW